MATQTLERVKEAGQDFEWYPTTNEIIDTVCASLRGSYRDRGGFNIMDCGAGDGRVLIRIRDYFKKYDTDVHMFAIEKSSILIEAMDKDIGIIGTDFDEQSLLDKQMDVIFCNPPYSVFENWMLRLIKEGFCRKLVIVVPDRWKQNKAIKQAIEAHGWRDSALGAFDFLKADRAARAHVDIVLLERGHEWEHKTHDPFDAWFDEQFKFSTPGATYDELCKDGKAKKDRFEVVRGKDLVQTLAEMYRADMDKLLANYKTLAELDADLLKELGVKVDDVRTGMSGKIKGLKNLYWSELLNKMEAITKRLTYKTRTDFLNTMMNRRFIDFTESNAYAIVIWTLKNVNQYFDSQLCAHYKRLTATENVKNYKSNHRMLGDRWRFQSGEESFTHYKLDYRLVLENHSAFDFAWGGRHTGLRPDTFEYIADTFVIANNLGFVCSIWSCPRETWAPGEMKTFRCIQPDGVNEIFAEIRAFKNGNIHMKLNKKFMLAFNVEAARINKWVRSPAEASAEMGEKLAEVEQAYKGNLQLPLSVAGLLGSGAGE